jgi:hypothetical protein
MRSAHRTLPVLAVAGLLAASVTGCAASGSKGSDSAKDFKGTQADVAQVVDDLVSASQKRDGEKICKEILAPALTATFTANKTVCKDVVKDNLGDTDIFGMTVKSVQVNGNTATAVVESDAGSDEPKQKNTFTFVKDAGANGVWKISSFGS